MTPQCPWNILSFVVVAPVLWTKSYGEQNQVEVNATYFLYSSLQVKEEAQQLALVFETVGAFKVKRKGGKGKQIFGT